MNKAVWQKSWEIKRRKSVFPTREALDLKTLSSSGWGLHMSGRDRGLVVFCEEPSSPE